MTIRDLYVDSSGIGGDFDAEWKEATRELWKHWKAGRWHFTTSTTTAAEMLGAPAKVRNLFESKNL